VPAHFADIVARITSQILQNHVSQDIDLFEIRFDAYVGYAAAAHHLRNAQVNRQAKERCEIMHEINQTDQIN